MAFFITQMEKQIRNGLEVAGAILDGRAIPHRLLGSELRNPRAAEARTNSEYEGHFLIAGCHTATAVDMQIAMGIRNFDECVGAILQKKLTRIGISTRHERGFDLIVGADSRARHVGKSLLKTLGNPPALDDIYPRRNSQGILYFDYPYPEQRDIRTLIVDEFFLSGGVIRETMDACDRAAERKNASLREESTGAKERPASFYYVGGAVAINLSPDWKKFLLNTVTFPVAHALRIEADTWTPESCPLCADGVSLYKI